MDIYRQNSLLPLLDILTYDFTKQHQPECYCVFTSTGLHEIWHSIVSWDLSHQLSQLVWKQNIK